MASTDIDHQFEYLAIEANLATATRFLDAVRKTCDALREHVELGSPRAFMSSRLTGLRVWPVRGFRKRLVFYIAVENHIEIVRVLHGARDLDSLLRDS